ncbi:hypothetical protein ACR3K2_08800 [Cryptosporidium serpentis]
MSLSESERKFLEFDWSSNVLWHQYYDNLYPTPTVAQLNIYKRKWFKKNVDAKLELHPKIYSSQPNGNSPTANCNIEEKADHSNIYHSNLKATLLNQLIIYSLLMALLLTSFLIVQIALPFTKQNNAISNISKLATLLYLFGLSSYLYEKLDKPIKFTSFEFWSKILYEDGFQSFLILIALFGITSVFPLVFISPMITSLFILVDFSQILNYKKFHIATKIIKNNRSAILQKRAYFEIFGLGLYILYTAITRKISLIYPFLHWNIIRTKYMFDPYLQLAFRQIDGHFNLFLRTYSVHIPLFIPKIYTWVSGAKSDANLLLNISFYDILLLFVDKRILCETDFYKLGTVFQLQAFEYLTLENLLVF